MGRAVWMMAAAGWLFATSVLASEEAHDRGRRIAIELCAECHGKDGRGISSDYPSLAGQHADYIVKQIFNFKTGQRRNDEMEPVLEKLLAADIRAVAQYFAELPAGVVPGDDPALIKEGRELYFRGNPATGITSCTACHGVYATGGARMPRMAGQNPVYLANQLRSFIKRVRQNDRMMHVSLAAMTEREVLAVAAYLANEE